MREKIQRTLSPLVPTWDTDALTRRSTRGDLHLPHPERPLSELTRAAVLVPLVEREHGLHVLLTQRTAHLKDHAGQISFPGGRAETSDAHPVATALRETDEEVGIKEDSISIAGCLDNYETGTGYLVVPVVGFVASDYALKVDSFEVAEVFEVPLSFILEPTNRQTLEREVNNQRRRYFAYQYQDRFIWGATAGMLDDLVARATDRD